MNTEQLKKILKPAVKKTKAVYLVAYMENEDETVTITYRFKNQKDSHLKIAEETWNGMQFKKEGKDILITDLNGLSVKINENGWARLITEESEEEDDE